MTESLAVRVNLNGFDEKLRFFTDVEAKKAIRSGIRKAGVKGRDLARTGAPKKSGVGAAGIRSTQRSSGLTSVARIYPSGPHAHIMRWQDQGVPSRHTRSDANRGRLPALHFFEQAAAVLDVWAPLVLEEEITAALFRSGLE